MTMPPQTSYSTKFGNPRAGTPADPSNFRDFISGLAAVALPFGIIAVEDLTKPGQFKLPAAAPDLAKNPSVVISTMAIESVRDSLPAGYSAGDMVNLMKAGRVWVAPEDTVTDGGTVYVRITANGAGKLQLGAVRSDADGGNASALSGAKYRMTGSGLVIIEVNQLGV